MASYKYLISGKESSYAEKHVDVVKLMHKAKFESKKEKMKLVLISASALFVLLLVMVGYAMSTEKFLDGLKYLFIPDFNSLAEKNLFSDGTHT